MKYEKLRSALQQFILNEIERGVNDNVYKMSSRWALNNDISNKLALTRVKDCVRKLISGGRVLKVDNGLKNDTYKIGSIIKKINGRWEVIKG